MRVLIFLCVVFFSIVSHAADPWDNATEPSEIYKRGLLARGLSPQDFDDADFTVNESDLCEYNVSTFMDRQVEVTVLTLQDFNKVDVKIVKCDKVKKGFIQVKKANEDFAAILKVANRTILPTNLEDGDDAVSCHHYLFDAQAYEPEEAEFLEKTLVLEIAVNPEFSFKVRRKNCVGLDILVDDFDLVEQVSLLY